jgi:hypothetical protein
MCGDYGKTDSNNDGTEGGFLDFLADIQDGGGAGRSGARFSSGDTSVLDSNNDNYVSEAEYMRGQLASEANEDRGRGGTFGDAYNNSRGVISNFSNSFGALPRGSIASEAALGSDGRDISTSRIARFMQGGGVLGAMGRGLTGGNIMSPEYVAPEMGDMTRDEYDRAIVKSFNSMGNTGEEPVPQEVAAAMGRVRGLNPRAVSVPANVPVNNVEVSTATNTADASGTPYVVGAEDIGGGMVKVFYGNNSSETMPAINYQLMMQNYV